jgi:AraC-like DNA-binding protein
MGRLLKTAAEKAECPHFGLETGKRIRTASLGVLGELMRNSATLREALSIFAPHQHRYAHGGVAYLLKDKRQAYFGYAIYQHGMTGVEQIYDGAAMAAFSLVNELTARQTANSLEVLLSRPEPKDTTPYYQSFGRGVVFDSRQTAVVMPVELLDQPIPKANAKLRRELEKRIPPVLHTGGLNTVTLLKRELRVGILEGCVSAPEFASRLGISARTLNRRLATAGLRFQKVLDETRCLFVQQLLANTRLTIGEISKTVGYSETSALTRSFAGWTGMSPSEWRAL